MQLDERKWKILQAIIKTYLETGEPVGSRTISKYADLNLRSGRAWIHHPAAYFSRQDSFRPWLSSVCEPPDGRERTAGNGNEGADD